MKKPTHIDEAGLLTNFKFVVFFLWPTLIVAGVCLILLASCKPGDIPFSQPKWEHLMNAAFNGTIGIPNEYTELKETYTTPRGAYVRSTVPVPPDFLNAIDEGIARQINRLSGMFPAWSEGKQISDYTVVLIDPNPGGGQAKCENFETEPGSPCLYIGGIKAAGTVVGTDEQWPAELKNRTPIVAPHQVNQQWRFREYFVNSIHNESEHVRSWKNRNNPPTGVFYYFRGEHDVHPLVWNDEGKNGNSAK